MAQHMPGVSAAVLSTDASGYHFTIPVEFSRDIIVLREQYGVARRLLRQEVMTSDKKTIPRRQSGVTAYWTSEGGQITASNKVWNDVELIAKDMTAISVVSAQVNADTIVPWAADLADEIAYAFSLAEDNAAFIGDGTSTYGKVVGVAQKLKTPDSSANASAGLVTATGSAWAGIILKDLQKLVGTLPQYADTGRACFLSHRAFFYTVIQPLLTALGGVTLVEGDRRCRTWAPGRAGRPGRWCWATAGSSARSCPRPPARRRSPATSATSARAPRWATASSCRSPSATRATSRASACSSATSWASAARSGSTSTSTTRARPVRARRPRRPGRSAAS
jgi:hypothetical protein